MYNQNKEKSSNNKSIFIAYCGDFKKNIGPPTSMLNLYELLKSKYNISATAQLANQAIFNKQCNSGKNKNKNEHSQTLKQKVIEKLRKSIFGELLADTRLLYLLLEFNIVLNYKIFTGKYDTIIITQPFFVSVFQNRKYKLIYIRRANEPHNVLIATSKIKRAFEKLFLKFTKFRTVHLVPLSDKKSNYCVIPNHFEQDEHFLNYRTSSQFQGACVGTWNWRKGADRLLEAAASGVFKGDINVYGTLGTDQELNCKLFSSNINYRGMVERPYVTFCVGDVYFSLSRLEGLQRSMVEALFQGCIVVAVKRPDSEFIRNFPGVYIVDWIDSRPKDSIANIKACVALVDSMDQATRVNLGEQNRYMAVNTFSSNKVLSKWDEIIHEGFKEDI